MKNLILVVLGGGAGSGARYLVSMWMLARLGTGFPWGTFTVNVTGSFLLGVLMQLGLTTLSAETRILLTTGFMGGFTTYSTFNFETVRFIEQGSFGLAVANASATFLTCLAAGALGTWIGRALST